MQHHQESTQAGAEIEWLKRALLECSDALHQAIGLLKGAQVQHSHQETEPTSGDEQEAHRALASLSQASTVEVSSIPSKLLHAVSKFNAENIANICKPHPVMKPLNYIHPLPAITGELEEMDICSFGNGGEELSVELCQSVAAELMPQVPSAADRL